MTIPLLDSLRHRSHLAAFRIRNRGEPGFECPVCGYRGPFENLETGTGVRRHALCPDCGAFERHRLQYLVMKKLLDGMDTSSLRMLHFAPEEFMRGFFSERFGCYETSDPATPDVDHRFDITDLPCEDRSYDFVVASHVLEHVADDQQAVNEVRRVLRPGGIAVLPVPIVAERTIEYPTPNPHETNHVRAPGPDYFERYRPAFARVETWRSDQFSERHQLYVYEDRTRWPTAECPLRSAMAGERHVDIVPVCFVD